MVIKYVLVAGVSAAAGYVVANMHLRKQYRILLEQNTNEIEDRLKRKYMRKAVQETTGVEPEFVEAAIDAAEALKTYQKVDVRPEVLAEEMLTVAHQEYDKFVQTGTMTSEEYVQGLTKIDSQENESEETQDIPPSDSPAVKVVQKTNYNAISTPSKAAVKTEEEAEESQISLITPDAFKENQFTYAQYSLSYLALSLKFVDATDRILGSSLVDSVIGSKMLKILQASRDARGGLDVLYIRNHTEQIELEIQIENATFEDAIGMPIGEADYVKTKQDLE